MELTKRFSKAVIGRRLCQGAWWRVAWGLGRSQDPSPVGLVLVTEARLAVGRGSQTGVTVRGVGSVEQGVQGQWYPASGLSLRGLEERLGLSTCTLQKETISETSAIQRKGAILSGSLQILSGPLQFSSPSSTGTSIPVCPRAQLIPAPLCLGASCWYRTWRERA